MKRIVGTLLFSLAVLLVVVLTRRQPQQASTTLRGFTMGTSYTVRLAARLGESERQQWRQRIEAVLDRVNDQMSTYQPDSEISRFNRSETDSWFAVSRDTAQVVSAALDVARQTGGAFDITVAPLVNLWSFGPDRATGGDSLGNGDCRRAGIGRLPAVAGAAGTARPAQTETQILPSICPGLPRATPLIGWRICWMQVALPAT